MTWSRQTITLACGCLGAGAWDELYVGLERHCPKHGQQPIVRMARVYETTGSRNASLTITVPQTGESKGPKPKDLLTPANG